MATSLRTRLLILDDDAAQMRALCSTLELEGYVATGFTSASEALAALRTAEFDLVLTDLTMPEMDGIAFLNAARQIDPQVVGIVMTGHGSVDTAVAAMKAGALDYILKPFTLRMILPVLERASTIRSLRTENSQLRQAEELVRSLNLNLEHCVRERTRQLTEANKELEAFSYSVSHDLRAPLRAISAFSGMLVEQYAAALDDKARGYLKRVLDAAERMSQLIEDLMRLSHVSGAELRRREVDVSKIVASVIEDLRARDPDRRVDASITAGLSCKADPALLRIALENLLSNAWKFTRNVANPRIEFGSRGGNPTTYFVSDNGAGFDADLARELFAPFRRLHSAEEFPGTGVGLSIVQRIIRRHGGSISAEGSLGHGATFSFTVPGPPESVRIGVDSNLERNRDGARSQ